MGMTSSRIYLITGDNNSGKTSFCSYFLSMLPKPTQQKWRIHGILSPPLIHQDEKQGILAVDLESGESRRLAVLNTGAPGGVQTQRWKFDVDTLRWCNQVLANSVPCDILIVDELGPLELQRRSGFMEGVHAVDSRNFLLGLVVVRSSLLGIALHRWPDAFPIQIVTPAMAESAAVALLQSLKEDGSPSLRKILL
jgi:nucleoside-triphosphatase THEP1